MTAIIRKRKDIDKKATYLDRCLKDDGGIRTRVECHTCHTKCHLLYLLCKGSYDFLLLSCASSEIIEKALFVSLYL